MYRYTYWCKTPVNLFCRAATVLLLGSKPRECVCAAATEENGDYTVTSATMHFRGKIVRTLSRLARAYACSTKYSGAYTCAPVHKDVHL